MHIAGLSADGHWRDAFKGARKCIQTLQSLEATIADRRPLRDETISSKTLLRGR